MYLAEKLGRTVDELGATMSAHEFGQWMAEFSLRESARESVRGESPAEPVKDGAVAMTQLAQMGLL